MRTTHDDSTVASAHEIAGPEGRNGSDAKQAYQEVGQMW